MDARRITPRQAPPQRAFGDPVSWALVALLAAALFLLWRGWSDWQTRSDPQTVAASALQALQEQNVLVPFAARYVAVVTSQQTRYGLAAQKTLIMPGTVRYEVDLGALTPQSVAWDAARRQLSVTLPPLRIAGPEIDMTQIREFEQGKVLLTLTDAERQLDAANRATGQRELMRLAGEATPMRLAGNAAKAAIRQNFELPLKAAGVDATVAVRFAGEAMPLPAPAAAPTPVQALPPPAPQATVPASQPLPAPQESRQP